MKIWTAIPSLMGFILAACTTQIPTPSQAEIQFLAAQTLESNQEVPFRQPPDRIIATDWASPTPTLIPPAGIRPASSPDSFNIATQIAMPKQGPELSRIYGLSVLDDGSLLVTIEISPLPGSAFLAELGADTLQCNSLPEYRNRIFCHGSISNYDLIQSFRLYQEGKVDPVFVSDLWVPAIPDSGLETSSNGFLNEDQESTPIPINIQVTPDLTP